jgi:hypothetical protein
MPPAFATAAASPAGQAPAIGAIRIGTRNPKRRQNAAARARGLAFLLASFVSDMVVVSLALGATVEDLVGADYFEKWFLRSEPPFPPISGASRS